MLMLFIFFFFFFQAEDGIRDIGVTGVQTCALPIFLTSSIALRMLSFVSSIDLLIASCCCLCKNSVLSRSSCLDMPRGWQLKHIKDRKSTRLNSSHANISYAVFCLKKKNTNLTYV